MSDKEKYSIGTKIRFIASEKSCYTARLDNGKIGKVVGHVSNLIGIYLPGSSNNLHRDVNETTWLTRARNLQIIPTKNQQLLFSFME